MARPDTLGHLLEMAYRRIENLVQTSLSPQQPVPRLHFLPALLAACALTPVTVQLFWTHNAEFSGFLAGSVKSPIAVIYRQ
jgi:hypothetical protein